MSTFISQSILVQAASADDGCAQFQIFGMYSSSNASGTGSLLATISSSVLVDEGITFSGSNMYDDYEVVCLDSSGVSQSANFARDCDPGENPPATPPPSGSTCDQEIEYVGEQAMPISYIVPIGPETGSITITYDAKYVPDKFIVDWGTTRVFNSGYVGSVGYQSSLDTALQNYGLPTEEISNMAPEFFGNPGFGSGSFDKTTEDPQFVVLKVFAPLPDTQWTATISCPNTSSDSGYNADTEYTASATPVGGGSCLTGDTRATGVCMLGQVGLYEEKTFTLSEGNVATVRATGTYYTGYGSVGPNDTSGQQTAQLLDSDGNIVQNFIMIHEQGTSPGNSTYSPSTYEITTPGTYKLRVYHLGCDNGEGSMGLYVDNCGEASNYETTRNTSVGTTAGVGLGTAFKVVWDTYQYQDAIDAQNLGKWLTGLSSITQNVWYSLDGSLITGGGFKVFDSTPTEEGDVNLLSNSQMRYVNDGLQYFIEVKNVSAAGNMHVTFTTNDQHKFRKG